MASFSELEKILRVEDFQGLEPQACICVGAGFSREDFKSFLLQGGGSFVGNAVLTFPELVQKIAEISKERILAQSPSRQEILRLLLSVPGTSERFPELKRLKRQGSFWKRLDTAIQSGRMSFIHWDEEQVFSQRLAEKQGENLLRGEIEKLAMAYESWLEGSNFWDPPRVLRQAVAKLGSGEEVAGLSKLPPKVSFFSTQAPESLEREFWDLLSRALKVQTYGQETSDSEVDPELPGLFDQRNSEGLPFGSWDRWHTIDDAADFIADALARDVRKGIGLTDQVVLIADHSDVRRSLKRALGTHGIPLADPRDPTRTRWDEGLKWSILPLEMVGRGFEREQVIAWAKNSEWTREIQERGIRNGIESYSGGKLVPLHEKLKNMQRALGGKRTVREFGLAHLLFMQSDLHPEQLDQSATLVSFYEKLWKDLASDLERVGLSERKAAPLYWLERLQNRINESPAPIERLKPEGGLDVFRFHQAPVKTYKKVWLLNLPSNWLSGEGVGDYWFSERDREILSSEFSVRSGIQVRKERVEALKVWTNNAKTIHILDSLYDPSGRERETIISVIKEIEKFGHFQFNDQPHERGSHERWLKSYGALRPNSSQSVQLPPRGEPVLTASLLDTYSRCGFQALANYRWKLRDLREPDTELWPDVRGNILHEAVRVLIENRDGQGNFSKTPSEALELAWSVKRPKGLLRGKRIESYVKYRLKQVLIAFCEKEREYIQRAGTQVLALEDVNFEMAFDGFSVVGEPDRIDEHPDGLFVMDYKTSSVAPNGGEMLENGYRLQLPFYALAAEQKFGKKPLGFQFIQLDRKGSRSAGVFFKTHNGKEPGKLTKTTANSKSLLNISPDDVWPRFQEFIQQEGAQYISGFFEAMPRVRPRKKECDACRVSDFCGYRRLAAEGSAESEGESE